MIGKWLYRATFMVCIFVVFQKSLVFAEKVDASDSRITWIGRTAFEYDGSVRFDWTGVYCRIRLKGDNLRIYVSDSGRNFYNVYIDTPMSSAPTSVWEIKGDTVFNLSLCKGKKIHNIVLQKRTEAEQGTTTFWRMETDGHFLQAEPYRSRQIEFIGDSYTCGYGIENCDSTDHFTPETENVCKSFVSLIAHRLKADYFVLAHSGMGIVRNYNSKFPGWTMPKRYQYRFDMDSTDNVWYGHSEWQPDLIVIFLGGNDFSCGVTPDYEAFKNAYINFLRSIYADNVLCCTKTRDTELSRYVERVVYESGMRNVSFFACDFDEYTNHRKFLGADKHPDERAHKRLAAQLIPIIQEILK